MNMELNVAERVMRRVDEHDVCDVLGYTNDSKDIKDHCYERWLSKRYFLTERGNLRQTLQSLLEGTHKNRSGEDVRQLSMPTLGRFAGVC